MFYPKFLLLGAHLEELEGLGQLAIQDSLFAFIPVYRG